jgi:adenine-specific DNA-methyltransferase
VKTSEVFKDYEFKVNGWRIIFRTIVATTDVGNVKSERRYFVLHSEKPIEIDEENKTCVVYFEYRQPTDEELRIFGLKAKSGEEKKTGIKQEELNSFLEGRILKQIPESLRSILSAKENEKTVLGRHLYKYTRKITSDFFIHKNLKTFLERELDYFIKTEIIDLNNLEPKHLIRARVVEGIGKEIIEFLSQIEDFQKKLWEKKKFVIRTEYVITTDLIPHEFYEEIVSNKEQLKEWKELGFGDIKKNDLNHRKLPVDTRHFSEEFKERLLEKLSERYDIDSLIDGILIKSENWQALNLLLNKFEGKVQCIYIDPPFNTGTNEFLYKNNYLDSSWISMMYDRLQLGKMLLDKTGSIYVRIDYHGNHYVRMLMDDIFGKQNFKNEIVINRTKKVFEGANRFITANDSLFLYSVSERTLFNITKRKRGEQKWIQAHSPGIRWSEVSEKYLSYYKPSQLRFERGKYYSRGRVFRGKVYMPPNGRHWTFSQERLEEYDKEGRIRVNEKGILEYLTSPLETIDSDWTDIPGYVVPSKWGFPTENSEQLLQRVMRLLRTKVILF